MLISLYLPHYWSSATNNLAQAPTISEYQVDITKETKPQLRPVQKDYSREVIRGYLHDTFAKYGLQDRIEEFEITITGESGWVWYADNGISKGLTMFTLGTWIENCTPRDERAHPYKSIDCMAKLVARGEQGRWDVWCMAFPNNDWRCRSRRLFYDPVYSANLMARHRKLMGY